MVGERRLSDTTYERQCLLLFTFSILFIFVNHLNFSNSNEGGYFTNVDTSTGHFFDMKLTAVGLHVVGGLQTYHVHKPRVFVLSQIDGEYLCT